MASRCGDVAWTYQRWPEPALHAETQLRSRSAYSPPANTNPKASVAVNAMGPTVFCVCGMEDVLSMQSTSIVSVSVLVLVMMMQH